MQKIILFVIVNMMFTCSVICQSLVEYSFRVEGACGMCQDRIEKLALNKGLASSANWDVDSKILVVEIDESKTSISRVRYEISQGGHDNGNFRTPDAIYNELHSCCKYRSENIDSESDHEGYDHVTTDVTDHGILNTADGFIYSKTLNGELEPLIGANVKLGDSSVGTITDADGYFNIQNDDLVSFITISYIGFETQSVDLVDGKSVEIILNEGHQMETVEITYKKKTTEISFVKTLNVETITRDELCKAACCNLSESFETNPSVDISFNDAITGTAQIQMLGLAGPYVQINRELIPDIRTMNNALGLNMTPGPWIQSIQLIKGTGSVVNGFESIAGQINVELKKPERDEILHVNGYLNNGGRLELNTNVRQELSDQVSTGILFHAKTLQAVHDKNDDGFTDMPMEKDFLVANRWKFERVNNIEGQIGVKYADLSHSGGYHDHFAGISEDHETHWQMYNDTKRIEVWGKMGYINQDKPQHSVGLQWSLVDHTQDASFGNTIYDNKQQSLFANLIYQNIFSNGHVLRTGLSYQLDDIEERVSSIGLFNRKESVPGAYVEYNIKKDDKWTIIPGLRIDHHNNYGAFITPRLHAKYNFSEQSIVRLIGGRGLRTANIFADNMGLFASSRIININTEDQHVNNPYGLDAEIAWNFGLSYTQGFTVAKRDMIFSVDLFRTQFENQIIADFETAGQVKFYNLEGESYSNSMQLKVDYELVDNLDIRLAYRLFDVKSTFSGDLLDKPMVSRHRAFINAAYKTKSDWHFDATFNWRGSKRLPNTLDNPIEYQRPAYSPDYVIVNAQIMKRWADKFDLYVGVENLLNYKQKDSIIAADDAFGRYFDASIVWAPLFGANYFVGFRYNLIKE